MANEEKAREIANTPIFLHPTSVEFGAEKMAEWKDQQYAEILKEECNTSYESGYAEGRRVAEREMIDKACGWIYEHFLDYCSDPIGCRFDDCANDLRKAMEE